MKRQLPPLNSLKAFEAAARLSSFSLAANELCVTQGAISRHIRQLEEWLGKPLFVRLNRKVMLTDAGNHYASEIAEALDKMALATNRQLARSQQRILRINALGTFTMRWLIPRLSSFYASNPSIEIRLTTADTPIASIGGEVDIAIRGGPQEIEDWTSFEFLAEHRLPVCSPALLQRLPLIQPKDLAAHTLLHTASLPKVWSQWLALAGEPNLHVERNLTLEHFHLTLQGALDGLGIAIGPVQLVADDVQEGRLVHPFTGPMLPPWRYFAYIHQTQIDNEAIHVFLRWLKQVGDASQTRQ